MLDVDGDGAVTYDEFLSVVKEGMQVGAARTRTHLHTTAGHAGRRACTRGRLLCMCLRTLARMPLPPAPL